jgi:hypothetical protein
MSRVSNFRPGLAADIHTLDHTCCGQCRELVLQHGALPNHHCRLVAAESATRTADEYCA